MPIGDSFKGGVVMVVDRFAAATADYSGQVQDKRLSTSAAIKNSNSIPTKQTAEDTTSFNATTNSVQELAKAAAQVSPTRQVKVEALRQAVKSAQYQLDSAKIAQSIADSV